MEPGALEPAGPSRQYGHSDSGGYSGDGGPALQAELNEPYEVRFDKSGNMTGRVHHVAGTGKQGFGGNGGPAKEAMLSGPKGISIAPGGDVYFADTESHSIRKIDVRKGTVELVAGTGVRGGGPDGDPLNCKLSRPHGIFVDADGSIFIGDSENHRVRVVR